MGVLDSDVPSSIAHYPVFSYDEMLQYLSSDSTQLIFSPRVPMLTFDGINTPPGKHAIIKDVTQASSPPTLLFFTNPQTTSTRYAFNESLITGDSGNPGFFVMNNKLVLILTLSTPSQGPTYGTFISDLNQAMTNLGGGYQVERVDLSNFAKKWP